MPRVTALYRYPVKGFTPEQRDSLTVLPTGRVAGDRVLAFRFADAPLPNESGWMPKTNYAVLANVPGIARVKLRYNEQAKRLSLDLGEGCAGEGRTVEDSLDAAGRERLAQAVANYLLMLPGNPIAGHPEKLPLRLVGDLDLQHFHDNAAGRVTLHSTASLKALGEALYDPDLDGRRFRSNIVIDGAHEWEEFGWVGGRVRIGQVVFDVVKTNVRCLATHAHPVTGERDCDIMNTLTRVFGHERPQFAVSMQPLGAGEVHVGDEVVAL